MDKEMWHYQTGLALRKLSSTLDVTGVLYKGGVLQATSNETETAVILSDARRMKKQTC